MAKFDVLVAGEINPDLILSDPDLDPRFGQAERLVRDASLTPGSSSVIYACGAARLGLKVAFAGIVGDDVFGRFMLDALNGRGVDTSGVIVDPARKTGVTVILNRGSDRAMLTHLGTIADLTAAQIPEALLAQTRHLHLASYFLQTGLRPDVRALFRRARDQGLTTSLDTNWDPAGAWAGVHELLPWVDLFLPNANEARALTRLEDIEAAARALAGRAGVVAVKLGAAGGLVVAEGALHRAPAPPVTVVDTVGAGDTFDAGFTYGFLHGWPLAQALNLAIACGSLSTQQSGGLAGQPTLDQASRIAGSAHPAAQGADRDAA